MDEASIAAMLSAAAENPGAVIVGTVPHASRRGALGKMCDLFFRLETGIRLPDAGSRTAVYPRALIDLVSRGGKREMGQTEMLVRAAWAGCPIVEMADSRITGVSPVPAAQNRQEQPVSPQVRTGTGETPVIRDKNGVGATFETRCDPVPARNDREKARAAGWRELLIHLRLLGRALNGWPHPQYHGAKPEAEKPAWWRRALRWVNPIGMWRELREGGASRSEMAAGVAVGVFIGVTPAWGLHTVLSLYAAKKLHLHPVAVMTGSHVSAPPMGPFLIAADIWLGHLLLHGVSARWADVTPFNGHFLSRAAVVLLDWTVGCMVIGATMAFVAFLIFNFLFRFIERRKTEAPAQ